MAKLSFDLDFDVLQPEAAGYVAQQAVALTDTVKCALKGAPPFVPPPVIKLKAPLNLPEMVLNARRRYEAVFKLLDSWVQALVPANRAVIFPVGPDTITHTDFVVSATAGTEHDGKSFPIEGRLYHFDRSGRLLVCRPTSLNCSDIAVSSGPKLTYFAFTGQSLKSYANDSEAVDFKLADFRELLASWGVIPSQGVPKTPPVVKAVEQKKPAEQKKPSAPPPPPPPPPPPAPPPLKATAKAPPKAPKKTVAEKAAVDPLLPHLSTAAREFYEYFQAKAGQLVTRQELEETFGKGPATSGMFSLVKRAELRAVKAGAILSWKHAIQSVEAGTWRSMPLWWV